MDNLKHVVHFCENQMDCRRALQLNYFGEEFTREECIKMKNTTCDNCLNYKKYVVSHSLFFFKIINMGTPVNLQGVYIIREKIKGYKYNMTFYEFRKNYFQFIKYHFETPVYS